MVRENDSFDARENGISLFDMINILKQDWRFWVGGTVLGLIFAGAALSILPERYEAIAVIRVGQVGRIGLIEPVKQAMERINMAGFRADLRKTLNADGKPTPLGKITTKMIKGTELFELSYWGQTQEQSLLGAQAVFEQLRERHRIMAQPAIRNLESQLEVLKKQAKQSPERRNLLLSIPKLNLPLSKSNDLILPLALVQQDSDSMQREIALADHESLMKEPNTRPTELLEAISASKDPVYPKKWATLLKGGLGGFALGIMLLIARRSWRAARRQID